MNKPRAFERIPVEKLATMPTKQLLGLRDRLLRLEEAPDASDIDPDEIDPGVIQFKSDPRTAPSHVALLPDAEARVPAKGG